MVHRERPLEKATDLLGLRQAGRLRVEGSISTCSRHGKQHRQGPEVREANRLLWAAASHSVWRVRWGQAERPGHQGSHELY